MVHIAGQGASENSKFSENSTSTILVDGFRRDPHRQTLFIEISLKTFVNTLWQNREESSYASAFKELKSKYILYQNL